MPEGTGVNPAGASAPAPAAPPTAAPPSPGVNPTPTQGPTNGSVAAPGPIPYERFHDVNTKYQTLQEQWAQREKDWNELVSWGREVRPIVEEHQAWQAKHSEIARQNMSPGDQIRAEMEQKLAERDKRFEEAVSGYQEAAKGINGDLQAIAFHRGVADIQGDKETSWILSDASATEMLGAYAVRMGYQQASGVDQRAHILRQAAEKVNAAKKSWEAEVWKRAKANEAATAADVEGSPPAPIEGMEDSPTFDTKTKKVDQDTARRDLRKLWEKTRPR